MARKRGRSVSDVTKYTAARPSPGSPVSSKDDDTLTSGTTFGLIAFVIFVVIVFAAVRFGTQSVESDIEARSTNALRAAGFEAVEVEATGTDVTLSGSYTTDQNDQDAYEAVAAVASIGEVDGQIWPISTDELGEATVRGAPLEATWDFGRITISGDVSTAEKMALVTATLGESFHTVDADDVVVLEGLADEQNWIGPILFLIQSSADDLPAGFLRVDGINGYVVLQGEVLERDMRDELNAKVVETAAAIGFDATPGVRLLETGPTEEEVEDLQDDLNELILDQVVEFEVKSFQLTENGTDLLDDVIAALESAPEVRVLIEGHTDDRGSDSENMELSEQRANAVLVYFIDHGLEAGRFDVVGHGEARPIESNNSSVGRARNRRIEFTALLDGVNTGEDQ